MGIDINRLATEPVFVYDTSAQLNEQLYQPFAYSDVFLRDINRNPDQTILHIWPMKDTLILGMMDRRLPYGNEAIKSVRTHGYRTVVRNSGGLAVISDEGILNFSLIISNKEEAKLSIQEAYLLMTALIEKMLKPFGKVVTHQLVPNSYCPGDFDMCIDNKKFAGIAQRRFKDGIAISIYLSVTGNQKERGELVKLFYEQGLQQEETKFKFPQVDPLVMETLENLLDVPLTVDDIKMRLLDTFIELNTELKLKKITDDLQNEYHEFYNKMIERNRKLT